MVNLPVGHNDLNLSYGKRVGHVYTAPGTYTTTVDVWGPDGAGGVEYLGRATREITISSVASIFSAANEVICVDPLGVGDSTTFPNSRVETSLDAAMTYYFANSGKRAIMLKSGITENALDDYNFSTQADTKHLYIGRYGGSTHPVINLHADGFLKTTGGFDGALFVGGVKVQGTWNEMTETGDRETGINLLGDSIMKTSIWDTYFDGCGSAVFFPEDDAGQSGRAATWLYNCHITNWQYFALFSQKARKNIISTAGTTVARQAGAGAGQGDNDQNNVTTNGGGPFRIRNGCVFHLQCSDLFSNASWTGSGTPITPDAAALIRFNTGLDALATAVIERNAFEGGSAALETARSNPNQDNVTVTVRPENNILFERNLVVKTDASGAALTFETSSVAVRNNLIFTPNGARRGTGGNHIGNYEWVYSFRNGSQYADSNGVDIALIYNDTIITLLDDTNREGEAYGLFDGQESDWVGFAFADLLHHAPNSSNHANVDNTDLDVATALATVGGTWTSRNTGLSWPGNSHVLDTAYATPAGPVTTAKLETGAVVGIGDAAQTYPNIWDFNGKVRVLAYKGAIEALAA